MLVDNPDRALAEGDRPVLSSDAWVIANAPAWVNFVGFVIARSVPAAWVVDVGTRA